MGLSMRKGPAPNVGMGRVVNPALSLLLFSCPHCVEYIRPRSLILLKLWRYISHVLTVASLGWVTLGAATEGVTPLFFRENLSTFFSRQFCDVTPDFFFAKTDDLILLITLSLFIAFNRVSPPRGCHPTPVLPVRTRFSTILCKFSHKSFLRVLPPWRVSPGAVRPPLVTPLCTYLLIYLLTITSHHRCSQDFRCGSAEHFEILDVGSLYLHIRCISRRNTGQFRT